MTAVVIFDRFISPNNSCLSYVATLEVCAFIQRVPSTLAVYCIYRALFSLLLLIPTIPVAFLSPCTALQRSTDNEVLGSSQYRLVNKCLCVTHLTTARHRHCTYTACTCTI